MALKKCTKCNIHKDTSNFHKDLSKPDGYYPSCKTCRGIQSKIYYSLHGHKGKKRRQGNQDYIYDILSDSCCSNCGESDIMLLDFDHRDPTEKIANISQMSSWSIENIDKEIAKCDILCAHCHRYRTAEQFNWYILEYLRKNKLTDDTE